MFTVDSLNQHYGSSHTLHDISLSIPAGSCTALLGRNGAGKSTLLKCLMGVLPVSGGQVRLDGEALTHDAPYRRARQGIAYVPQGREIFPRLTVEENLRVAARHGGDDFNTIRAEMYDMFPVLQDMQARRGGDLSGGQQQQLAIARALIARPRLLMLDEPTEGIQPSIIKDIERAIRALTARGMTILLVEQYFNFAHALADRFVVLARGRVEASGVHAEMDTPAVRRHLAV